MTSINLPPHKAYIEIVKEGTQLADSFGGANDYNVGTCTIELNVKVDAGQNVWCRNAHTDVTDKSYLHSFGNCVFFWTHHIVNRDCCLTISVQ